MELLTRAAAQAEDPTIPSKAFDPTLYPPEIQEELSNLKDKIPPQWTELPEYIKDNIPIYSTKASWYLVLLWLVMTSDWQPRPPKPRGAPATPRTKDTGFKQWLAKKLRIKEAVLSKRLAKTPYIKAYVNQRKSELNPKSRDQAALRQAQAKLRQVKAELTATKARLTVVKEQKNILADEVARLQRELIACRRALRKARDAPRASQENDLSKKLLALKKKPRRSLTPPPPRSNHPRPQRPLTPPVRTTRGGWPVVSI